MRKDSGPCLGRTTFWLALLSPLSEEDAGHPEPAHAGGAGKAEAAVSGPTGLGLVRQCLAALAGGSSTSAWGFEVSHPHVGGSFSHNDPKQLRAGRITESLR